MLNNNFSKLVKLYKRYQKQQRNQKFLKLFGIVALLGAAYLLYTQATRSKPQQEIATEKTAPQPVNEPNTTTADKKPSVTPQAPQKPLQKTAVATPKVESMPKEVHKRTPAKKHAKKSDETFQLKVTQRKSLYKLLVDYKNNKSYDTAIKIAQFYLEEKEYDKAVKWAVEASKKDPTQAQSWIIYARAKKALGKPEVAKRALGIYLKHNYSQTAQDLLDSL